MEKFGKEIDEIDSEIARLLEERFKICSEIGELKSKNNTKAEDRSREKKTFEKIGQTDLECRDNIKKIETKILLELKRTQDSLK